MQCTHTSVEPERPSTRREAGRPKRWLVTSGKCVISSVLIFWLLKDTSLHEIGHALQSSHMPTMLLAFSLHFLGCFISVVRWRILLRCQHIEVPFWFLLKSYMVAIFFNNILPSTIGGDVVRIHDTYRIGNNKGGSIAAVFVDRLLGIFVLIIFALFSLMMSEKGNFFLTYIHGEIIVYLLFFAAVVVTILKNYYRILQTIDRINLRILKNIRNFITKSIKNVLIFKSHKRNIGVAIFLSVLLQINVVVYYYLISLGMDLSISIKEFFIIVPIAIFIMMIPISINGLGLRENIFVVIFSIYGVSKYNSIAVAWADHSMVFLLGVIGGIVYAIRK